MRIRISQGVASLSGMAIAITSTATYYYVELPIFITIDERRTNVAIILVLWNILFICLTGPDKNADLLHKCL